MNTTAIPARKRFASETLLALALITALAGGAQAAVLIKANNATALNVAGSYTAGGPPTISDSVTWNNTVVAANTVALGGNLNMLGIIVSNPGGAVVVTEASGNVLTLGSSGIDMSGASQNLTLLNSAVAGEIAISANQVWNVTSGRTLTLFGGANALNQRLTGSGNIQVSGSGTITMNVGDAGSTTFTAGNGNDTYTGNWTISGGRVITLRNGTHAWGTGSITLDGGTIAQSQGNWVWANNISLNTSTTSIIDDANTGSARTLKLQGIISGNGNLTFAETGGGSHSADGGYILTGANTLSGTVTINSPALVRVGGVPGNDTTTTSGTGGTLGTASVSLSSATSVLSLTRSDNMTFANNVSGAGILRIGMSTAAQNTGITTVSGVNTHSGGVQIQSAATLKIGSTTALGSGPVILAGNGLFDNGTGSPLTVANALNLTGGSPTFIGTGDMTLNGAVTLAGANRTITVNGGALTLGGAISGAFNLTKQGAGTLVLSGANTSFANPIAVGAGVLKLGSADALGTTAGASSVSVGAVLDLNGQVIGAEPLTLAGSGISSGGALINGSGTAASLSGPVTLGANSSVGGNGNSTLSGVVGGAFALTKVGAGTVTLNNAETYSGATTISDGTLALGASGTIASTPSITVTSGAVLDISASSFTLSGSQTLVAGRTSSFATDVNGTLSSAGTINPAGASTAGTLTVGGGLSLTGGALNLDLSASSTSAGGGVNDLIAASGALNLTGSTTINVNWVGGAPTSGTYTLITGASLGSGSAANLVKGTGLTDGARISFSFDTTTTPGTVYLVVSGGPASLTWVGDGAGNVWDIGGSPNWDNAGSGDNYYDLDSVTFNDTTANGAVDVSVTVSPTSVTVNNSSTDYSFSGAGKISGTGSLTKSGSRSLTVGTPNDNSGGTTVNGGTVTVVDGGALGTGAVVNNALLQLDNASALSFNNSISGTGALTKTNTGTATLSGVNTYSGNTTIALGTLKIGAGGPIPNGAGKGDVILAGSLDLAGTGETINGLSGAGTVNNSTGTGTLIVGDGDATSSFSGVIQNTAGTLALTKTGAGTLSLSGANTYGGATTISGGTLAISGGSAIPNGSTVSIANTGTLLVNATETIGGLSTASNSTVNVASGTLTYSTGSILGNLTGAGTLIRNGTADTGTGQFTNANALNFTGTLRLRGSTPSASPASMQGGTGRFWLNDVNGSQAAGTAFALDTGASGTDAQDVIIGDWDANSGNRKLTLSSLAGYGTLRTDAGNAGTRTIVVDQSGGDTTFNGMLLSHTSGAGAVRSIAFEKKGSSSLTMAGIIGKQTVSAGVANADVALTVTAGKLVLSAVNTLTGPTVVNGGTLVINGTHPAGASVTVNSGGTLGGTGIISGTLTVAAGGVVAAGASIGTLSVGGTPSLGGTLLMEIDRNGGTPLADKINFTGSATLGGTLVLTNLGAAVQSGDTFDLFDGTAAGVFSSVVVPPGTGGAAHWNTNNLPVNGTVTYVNTAPAAQNITAGVVHGGSISLPVIGGKFSATDAEGDTITLTSVGTASSGTSGMSGSNVTYSATGSPGTNTFTYTVTDALGATDTKTVTVIVSSPEGFNKISGPTPNGGQWDLTYLGVPGEDYALDESPDLVAPYTWHPVVTNTASGAGAITYTVPLSYPSGSFRTRHVP